LYWRHSVFILRYVKEKYSLRKELSVDMPSSILYLASGQLRVPSNFPRILLRRDLRIPRRGYVFLDAAYVFLDAATYLFLDAATLTEVFPCFFLGCKANARV
jgi:hypothetical protein